MVTFALSVEWIGVGVSIIFGIITLLVYLNGKQYKLLSHQIISEYPLVSIDEEVRGKLQILLDNNPVENLHLLLIKFMNTGNLPIAASDYERPITIQLQNAAYVLSAEVVEAFPFNLQASLLTEKNSVTVEPFLMNREDYFTIKILAAEYDAPFQLDARIIGVRALRTYTEDTSSISSCLTGVGVLALALLAIYGGITGGSEIGHKYFMPSMNVRPTITSLDVRKPTVQKGESTLIVANVAGIDEAEFSTEWAASDGKIYKDHKGTTAMFHAPDFTTQTTVVFSITDKFGRTDTKQASISVVEEIEK